MTDSSDTNNTTSFKSVEFDTSGCTLVILHVMDVNICREFFVSIQDEKQRCHPDTCGPAWMEMITTERHPLIIRRPLSRRQSLEQFEVVRKVVGT